VEKIYIKTAYEKWSERSSSKREEKNWETGKNLRIGGTGRDPKQPGG